MKWHRQKTFRLAMAAGLVCAVSWGTSVLMRGPDPVYQGKRLSEHLLAVSFYSNFTPAELAEWEVSTVRTKAAVMTIRGEAVPLLRNWLRARPTRVRESVSRLLIARGVRWRAFTADRARIALGTFQEMPELGGAAVPEIIEVIRSGNSYNKRLASMVLLEIIRSAPNNQKDRLIAQVAPVTMEILLNVGPVNVAEKPYLIVPILETYEKLELSERERIVLRFLTNSPSAAVWRKLPLKMLDPDSHIEKLLKLSSEDDAEKVSAAAFFAMRPVLGNRVVPLLQKELNSTNAVLVAAAEKALAAYERDSSLMTASQSNVEETKTESGVMGKQAEAQ